MSLAWTHVHQALWLWAPRSPKTGRIGGRIWLWALPFTLLSGAINALPIDPTGPLPRDFPSAILTERVTDYFDGNYVGFAMLVAVAFLAPVAEELMAGVPQDVVDKVMRTNAAKMLHLDLSRLD